MKYDHAYLIAVIYSKYHKDLFQMHMVIKASEHKTLKKRKHDCNTPLYSRIISHPKVVV